ncbi:MAG: acyltransferase domain-containing protein, partial [Planctomycetes bacterium]|nr:acyltransferase domain-containing protein [Planctomycetota bacterium]
MTDATRILEPQRTRPEAAPASGPVHLSWDSELFVLRGDDREDLRRRVKALGDFLEHHPEVVLKDLAATLNTELPAQGSRLALVAGTVAELRTRLTRAGERLADPRCRQIRDAVGIYFFEQPLHPEGRLAFLFPGEGAQYLNMLGDLSIHFAEVRNLVEDCDEAARRAGHENHALSRAIFLPPDATPEEQAQAETELRSLGNAMLSVLMADWALYQCLLKLGLRPDAMAGHSMGELAALWAGGALATDSVMLGELAATIESVQQQEEQGGAEAVLLAVGAGRATVAEVVGQAASSQVYLAMDNCPHQTVVVGPPGPMARIEGEFQARKVYCERLPFRRPYHTPLFEPLLGPVQQMFAGAVFQPPQTPVYSCTTSRPFPADPDEIRRLTVAHWASPVEFTRMIEAMYADGVRLFVEAGPRGNLTSFVEDILRGQPCAALAANVQRRSGVTQFNHLAGQLAAHHVPLRLEYFYQRRNPQRVAWETSPTLTMNAEPPRNPSPPVHNARGIVLAQYLNTMEQFLDLQREVTECYLAGRRRVPAAHHPNRLSSPGINGSDSLPPASSSRPRAWPLMGEVFRHEAGQELIMRRKLDLRED